MSTVGDDIARVFAAVVATCDAEGLIGRELFAIDGVKFPSNAAKRRSGTRADFERQATKLEAAAQTILARHRAADQLSAEPTLLEKEKQRVERLENDAAQVREWLQQNPFVAAMQGLLTAESLITADAGYHSDANVQQLAAMSVDALIADNDMRRRDERFATQDHHKAFHNPLHDKANPAPV